MDKCPAGRILLVLSVLIVHIPSPRQPFRPGGGRAALWQTRERNTTVTRVLAPNRAQPCGREAVGPRNHRFAAWEALRRRFWPLHVIAEGCPAVRGPELRPNAQYAAPRRRVQAGGYGHDPGRVCRDRRRRTLTCDRE